MISIHTVLGDSPLHQIGHCQITKNGTELKDWSYTETLCVLCASVVKIDSQP